MPYNQRFDEYTKLLSCNIYEGVTTEQNTTFVNVKNYRRLAIVIKTLDVGTTLDADVEITTDGVTAGLFTLKSITQLASGDDDEKVVINIRDEELSKPSGASSDQYDYIRVETTPNGAATYVVMVFGLEPRYAPVGTTEWDQVVA